jgi:hypothetical protein
MEDSGDAEEVFEELKRAIDQACSAADYGLAVEKAKVLGLQKLDESKSFSLRHRYVRQFGGATVSLEFRSWDQSQAFSIRPDMNRFTLSHGAEGKVLATYSNEYED